MTDTKRCPNCGKVGTHHLSAGESGAERDEYRCDNSNCRVAYYEVEPPEVVPDGGHLPSDIRDGPHTIDRETGEPVPLRGIEAGAYPETELLVGLDGAQVACPYCDTGAYLHSVHECPECGATFELSVRWKR